MGTVMLGMMSSGRKCFGGWIIGKGASCWAKMIPEMQDALLAFGENHTSVDGWLGDTSVLKIQPSLVQTSRSPLP